MDSAEFAIGSRLSGGSGAGPGRKKRGGLTPKYRYNYMKNMVFLPKTAAR